MLKPNPFLLSSLALSLLLSAAPLSAQDKKAPADQPEAEKTADPAAAGDGVTVELPAKVSATIKKETKNGKIVSIERQTEGDQTGYIFTVAMNEKEYSIFVAADGTLMELILLNDEEEKEGDIEVAKAPEPVQKAIAALAKAQKISQIREAKHRTTYNFQVKEDGQVYDVSVDSQGQLLAKRKGEAQEAR